MSNLIKSFQYVPVGALKTIDVAHTYEPETTDEEVNTEFTEPEPQRDHEAE
ncbi:hypothetical protein ACFQY3_21055 [Paenibacillus farraposensis]